MSTMNNTQPSAPFWRNMRQKTLRLWHAAALGGVVVAWITGDEDTYAMHLFAGWLVVAVLTLRPLLGGMAPRPPLLRWSIWTVLAGTALAAISGVAADRWTWLEDPHEALAQVMLWAAAAHGVAALYQFKLRRWWREKRAQRAALAAAVALLLAQTAPAMADPRADLLADYARQAGQAFSAQRGESLFRSRNSANPEAPSCTTCHTEQPTAMGRHVKTGRAIEPVAISANPKRFTDKEKVEERFGRDCPNVLGRSCTALEKGDYITFMLSK